MKTTQRPLFWKVWGAPIVLGGLTCFGLLAGLLGAGIWNWLAWITLSVPLVAGIGFWLFPRA